MGTIEQNLNDLEITGMLLLIAIPVFAFGCLLCELAERAGNDNKIWLGIPFVFVGGIATIVLTFASLISIILLGIQGHFGDTIWYILAGVVIALLSSMVWWVRR